MKRKLRLVHSVFLLVVPLLSLLHPCLSSSQETDEEATSVSYGVDVSLPVFKSHVSRNYPHLEKPIEGMPIQPLGNRQAVYNAHLKGCRNYYSSKIENMGLQCDRFEYHRQIMNQRQPQSMVNLTETGYKKIRAPAQLKALIDEFWFKNQHAINDTIEVWQDGNSYVNHWDKPTHLVSVDDTGLRGSGVELKRHIWSAASAVLEEWTQEELQPCSLYGIRVYHEGAIMMPHVDRLPLVASAIINVAQDLDEPWPWELYDHDGMAHNVTLDPGDMLLFESHSVIHGHPFPLQGRYSANIYIHFEPTGHGLAKNESGYFYRKDEAHHSFRTQKKNIHALEQEYRDETQAGHGSALTSIQKGSSGSLLPPYIQEASPEEKNWLTEHPKGWSPPPEILPPGAHVAAKTGQLEDLANEIAKIEKERIVEVLSERDENGFQVLHQGVVSGNTDVVKFLVDKGANINSRTHGGYGETPLRIAEKRWGENSLIAIFLRERGALSVGPEL